MDAWVGVVGALAGVAVGAWADALRGKASFWREKRWEHEQERRRRLEDLYTAVEEVHQGSSTYSRDLLFSLAEGKPPGGAAGPVLPFSKVAMLTQLYFPELAGQVELLFQARDAMVPVLWNAIHAHSKKDPDKRKAMEALATAEEKLGTICEGVTKAIASVARTHDWKLKGGDS